MEASTPGRGRAAGDGGLRPRRREASRFVPTLRPAGRPQRGPGPRNCHLSFRPPPLPRAPSHHFSTLRLDRSPGPPSGPSPGSRAPGQPLPSLSGAPKTPSRRGRGGRGRRGREWGRGALTGWRSCPSLVPAAVAFRRKHDRWPGGGPGPAPGAAQGLGEGRPRPCAPPPRSAGLAIGCATQSSRLGRRGRGARGEGRGGGAGARGWPGFAAASVRGAETRSAELSATKSQWTTFPPRRGHEGGQRPRPRSRSREFLVGPLLPLRPRHQS